jgi:hypothetical protein
MAFCRYTSATCRDSSWMATAEAASAAEIIATQSPPGRAAER